MGKFTPKQWAARARQKNAAEQRKYPLLARMGVLEPVTGEQLAARSARRKAEAVSRHAEALAHFAAVAGRYRAQLAQHISQAELANLDDYRARTYPPGQEYSADFYWRMVRERGLPLPEAA